MSQYAYHTTWDALNFYDKKGYALYLVDGRLEWTNNPSSNDKRVAGVNSFRNSSEEVYSKNPTSKNAQYSAEIHTP